VSYIPTWREIIAEMMAVSTMACVGFAIPDNPNSYVPSPKALVEALSLHESIIKPIDEG
jgi:hypothetical protein